MRRFVAMALIAVLAAALWSNVARADLLSQLSQKFAAATDLRAAFAMRTFGRLPDGSGPSVTFVGGSPLHGLAFSAAALPPSAPVAPVRGALPAVPPIASIALAYDRVFDLSDTIDRYADFADPAGPASGATFAAASTPNLSIAGPGERFSLSASDAIMPVYAPSVDATILSDTPPAFAARLKDATLAIGTPERVGALQIDSQLAHIQFSDSRTRGDQLQTTATIFDLRNGGAAVKINLGGDYEHLVSGGGASFPYIQAPVTAGFATTSIDDVPGSNPAALASNGADVTTRGLNAGLALPLTRNLTMGLQYGTQRLTGSYGTSFTPNVDANKYSYLGNITFALPSSSSAITLSARQYRYQDNLTPFSYTQTRADLNFTVKF
jgi:hypothetical protein